MATNSLLHWCHAANPLGMVDAQAVRQGKMLRMRAEKVRDPYTAPVLLQIKRESFFLNKILKKLGGKWHPINPFPTTEFVPGTFLSREWWGAGVGASISNQTTYYFSDNHGHKSGALTVSQATHWTKQRGITIDSRITAKVPGGPAEVGIEAGADNVVILEGVGASEDPEIQVSLMTPSGEGEANLIQHVRDELYSTTDLELPDRESR